MASPIGVVQLLHYDRSNLRGDLTGGLTVTAYLIPQVMAYSALAGLPAQSGLIVIVVSMAIYALLGSSRLLSVGPESTTALMTAAVLAPLALGDPLRYASLAALLALLVGIYALAAGVLRLGFIGDLLSRPVLIGYMAGVAVIMISSQLGKVTGVDVAGDSFLEDVASFFRNASDGGPSWPTVAMGLGVAALLLIFTPRFPRVPVPLVVMLLAALAVAVFGLEAYGIETVETVSFSGLQVGLPATEGADVSLLLLPALGIFVVGYTDNILTARAFATRTGSRIHNNQEFLAMGSANVGASLVGGFPVSSSASRTVIAEASGARTQVYSLTAAGLVVLAVLAFANVISAFPNAALGGLVIYAAIRLIDVGEFRRLWAFRRREFLLAISATVAVLLFDILYGVLAAVAISVIELLTRVARPHSAVLGQSEGVAGWHDLDDYPGARQVPGLVIFRYDSPLFFANAEDFYERCQEAIDTAEPPVRWFVINMEAITEVDITGLDALEEVRHYCAARRHRARSRPRQARGAPHARQARRRRAHRSRPHVPDAPDGGRRLRGVGARRLAPASDLAVVALAGLLRPDALLDQLRLLGSGGAAPQTGGDPPGSRRLVRIPLQCLIEQHAEPRVELLGELVRIGAPGNRHRFADRHRDRLAAREVATVVGQDPVPAEQDHRDQRDVGGAGHPDRAVLDLLDLQRSAHGGLGEHPDQLARLEGGDGVAEGGGPGVAVDRDVLHAAHERAGDGVLEDAVLGHEAHESMPHPVGGDAAQGEVEVAGVVDGEDGATGSRDVLLADHIDAQPEPGEQRAGGQDDGAVDRIRHGPTVVGSLAVAAASGRMGQPFGGPSNRRAGVFASSRACTSDER